MLGMGEIVFLVALAVVLFNLRRLPDMARSLKGSMKAFRGGLKGEEPDRPVRDVTPRSPKERE